MRPARAPMSALSAAALAFAVPHVKALHVAALGLAVALTIRSRSCARRAARW